MKKKTVFMLGATIAAGLTYKYIYDKNSKKSQNFIKPSEEDLNKTDDWNHKYIHANNLNFHYVEDGDYNNELVILLHGFPEHWHSWRNQIPFLSRKYHVVAIDMRGYNLSDKPKDIKDYRLELLVNDVKEIIQELGYEKAHIIGHDWGGAVAWGFASMYPEMLNKLIILNSPHPIGMVKAMKTSLQLLHSWYILFFQLPTIPELSLSINDYKMAAESLRKTSIYPEKTFNSEDIERYIESIKIPNALSSMINYYRALLRYGIGVRIRKVENKTLIIWGEKDTFLLKDVNQNIDQYVSDIKIEYIEDASHWVHRDQPQKVNNIIDEFLSN
jgi:pimeloyl-ACP methyl ester carboxylesterase